MIDSEVRRALFDIAEILTKHDYNVKVDQEKDMASIFNSRGTYIGVIQHD